MSSYEKFKTVWTVGNIIVIYLLNAFILKKAGYPIWAGFTPIYNIFCLFYSTYGHTRYVWLMLVPIVNIVLTIVTWVKFVSMFGVDYQGFTSYHRPKMVLWMALFPAIVYVILAFDPTEYKGPYPGPDPFRKNPLPSAGSNGGQNM